MTDRFNCLIVTLERDMRDDDAEGLIAAIKHLRGVADVQGNVSDPLDQHVASMRIKDELSEKLYEVIRELR